MKFSAWSSGNRTTFRRTPWRGPLAYPRRINEFVLEKRRIRADTALRLVRFFGTTAELWAGLQADYDLRLTRYAKEKQIERVVEPLTRLPPAMA